MATGIADSQQIDSYLQSIGEYLEHKHAGSIHTILSAPDASICYPLHIHMYDLLDSNPPLCHAIYEDPRTVIPLMDDAIVYAQEKMAKFMGTQYSENILIKRRVHARLLVHGSGMDCPEMQPSIGDLRVGDEGRLITIRGTVIRAGTVQMLEGMRWFECSKCKHKLRRHAFDALRTDWGLIEDPVINLLSENHITMHGQVAFKVCPQVESRMAVEPPSHCPSEKSPPCPGLNFKCLEGSVVCCDYQELKVQEPLQMLVVGAVPRSISVILDDDLVDSVQPGDDVMITGVLATRWKNPHPDSRCDLEHIFQANNIWNRARRKGALTLTPEVINLFEGYWEEHVDDPLRGRNGILERICPQVHGLFPVKLAVALALIGGVERLNDSGSRVRGESHLLLVGDPGTGKSQFLKFAAKLSERAVLTTGLGSTTAGLTVTALKQDGQWMLEAGALVLADGGLCCIDEFGSIRPADKGAILEAMEQQTISVAKAGLVTTLNTRATVFAVTNPKGQYDPEQSLAVNTSISAPLLSRFDVVLVIRDLPNPEWDRSVSYHILNEHAKGNDVVEDEDDPYAKFWTLLMLQSYIQYVKEAFKPELGKKAETILMRYYQFQRRSIGENGARTTIRMLESLIRLSQAHARLMFRNKVEVMDAIAAILCVERSMFTGSTLLDSSVSTLHEGFAEDPGAEYIEQEQAILGQLDLLSLDKISETMEPSNGSDSPTASQLPKTLSTIPRVTINARLTNEIDDPEEFED